MRSRSRPQPPRFDIQLGQQVVQVITKQLGSLWVIRWFLDQLGVAEIIDRQCPAGPRAALTHGQAISALVANRLTAPRPLWRVEDWAATWAVEEVFGIRPSFLNDDRLGRALDAIYPHLEHLKGAVAFAAIERFGIDTSVFHWDFTSLSFFGAYEDQDEQAPAVTWGHAKGHTPPGLKQILVGLAATADGGIPLNPTPVDGSAAEVAQVVQAMEALKRAARRTDFLLVGDTKLISQRNILAACQAGIRFCGPAPASRELDEVFRAIPQEELRPLIYHSDREAARDPAERTVFMGAERPWVMTDGTKTYRLRRIFVLSSEEQAACRKNRRRQMEKAEAEMRKVQSNLGTRWYDTPNKVQEKVERILRERRVRSLYRIQVGGEPGAPTFHWERDLVALAEAEALDGYYVLVTNLPAEEYDASAVLQLYKGQYRVERRFADFKGPLAASPVFLKDNRRIAALVFVVYLALLIYCLVERQARRALQDPARARWTPLAKGNRRRRTYAIHDLAEEGKIRWVEGQPAQRPTARNLFDRLRHLTIGLVVAGGPKQVIPPRFDPIAQKIHELLDVPPPFSI